jgi:hypothetical protein
MYSQFYCGWAPPFLGTNPPNPFDVERVLRDPDSHTPVLKNASGPECTRQNPANCALPWGGEYDSFLIPSYTRVSGNETRLYFVMSTWNPYQVVLMRTSVFRTRSLLSALGSTLRNGWDSLQGH